MPAVGNFIHSLIASRPTADAREAFTNLSAALLEAYPFQAPTLLFASQPTRPATTNNPASTSTPTSYLLINLLLIDLRATLPTLLSALNTPSYPSTSHRLTSAFNTISHFVGYLLRALDSPSNNPANPWPTSPDLLLKLRTALSETMSLTAEYLRDRWDASVAGAMGLHPDARGAAAVTAAGAEHLTLAWDSKSEGAADDPLVLAAVRALAIWVREDDGEELRREVSGLCDMLVELYKQRERGRVDFRGAVLVALEGVVEERKGREAVLENGGWEVLAGDLVGILEGSGGGRSKADDDDEREAARGVEIVRVLMAIAEAEEGGTREAWMDLVTKVAAWYVPEGKQTAVVEECQVAALQLVTTLLANAHPGMRKRYVHSMTAVLGIANRLRGKVKGDKGLEEALEDVLETLGGLR